MSPVPASATGHTHFGRDTEGFRPDLLYGEEGAQAREKALKAANIPSWAYQQFHKCPECNGWFHTLCRETGGSAPVFHKEGSAKYLCSECGDTHNGNLNYKPHRCSNCDSTLDDWNPSGKKARARKAEEDRKWAYNREVLNNRNRAWPIIQARLIDEYLQAQGLKWRIEA